MRKKSVTSGTIIASILIPSALAQRGGLDRPPSTTTPRTSTSPTTPRTSTSTSSTTSSAGSTVPSTSSTAPSSSSTASSASSITSSTSTTTLSPGTTTLSTTFNAITEVAYPSTLATPETLRDIISTTAALNALTSLATPNPTTTSLLTGSPAEESSEEKAFNMLPIYIALGIGVAAFAIGFGLWKRMRASTAKTSPDDRAATGMMFANPLAKKSSQSPPGPDWDARLYAINEGPTIQDNGKWGAYGTGVVNPDDARPSSNVSFADYMDVGATYETSTDEYQAPEAQKGQEGAQYETPVPAYLEPMTHNPNYSNAMGNNPHTLFNTTREEKNSLVNYGKPKGVYGASPV